MRILVLVLVVGAILGGAPATQLAALQFAGTPETENPEPCIEVVNEIGARRWMGEPGADANASSQQLEEIANTYPHQVSGTSFCSDYSGVEIFILAEGAEARAAAEAAAIESRVPVYIRTAEYSLTELRAEQKRLRNHYSEYDLVGSYPRVYGDGVGIVIDASSRTTAQDELQLADDLNGATSVEIPLWTEFGTEVPPVHPAK